MDHAKTAPAIIAAINSVVKRVVCIVGLLKIAMPSKVTANKTKSNGIPKGRKGSLKVASSAINVNSLLGDPKNQESH
jgi:hypothetical protein